MRLAYLSAAIPLLGILLLSACGLPGLSGFSRGDGGQGFHGDGSSGTAYVCRNDEIVGAAFSHDGRSVQVAMNGVTAEMKAIDAPFGTKYKAQDGTTFWVNGRDVMMEWRGGEMLFCRQPD